MIWSRIAADVKVHSGPQKQQQHKERVSLQGSDIKADCDQQQQYNSL